jgi:hypothetical protein
MAQQYNKIIKENLEKVILQLIHKTNGIELVSAEILYPELHYTIEREADFLEKVTTKDHQTLIFHIEFQATNEKAMADDLQPFIIKQEQKMALTLNIENDLRFQQGERRKALEIARQLISKGLDKNLVAETTGLPLAEINKLAEKIKGK